MSESLEEIEYSLAQACRACDGTKESFLHAGYWCRWCGGSGLERHCTYILKLHWYLRPMQEPAPYLAEDVWEYSGTD